MGIQHSTNDSPALLRLRARFVDGNRLRDYRLSSYNLMRMVRSATSDRAAIDRIRERFLLKGAGWIQWSGPTWDHCEFFGRDRMPLCLVSHPYAPPKEDCPDLALFERAGLDIVLGGQDASWYGHGSYSVHVQHPAFSVSARPASASRRPLAASSYTARLHRAAPALLALARERAEQLAQAIALVPCVGPRGVGPCLSCELRRDYDRIMSLVNEVEGP